MIKEIKYNRSISELNKILDCTASTNISYNYKLFYNRIYFDSNPIYHIDGESFYIRYHMFVEENLTFGLDEKTLSDLIRKKHNIKNNRVVVVVDHYGHYIEINYD